LSKECIYDKVIVKIRSVIFTRSC